MTSQAASSNPWRSARAWRRGGHGPRDEVNDDLKNPLGELVASFKNSDLKHTDENVALGAIITACTYEASYNWLDTKIPTIVVPGKNDRLALKAASNDGKVNLPNGPR
jgi:hypothetical protein